VSDLFDRAERWISHDPDPDTKRELASLVAAARAGDAKAGADLGERFAGPLEFGTAGLRGLIGAGETRMNRAVVLRTAAGLGAYLLAQDADGARSRGVVVGYDGRRMGPEFAEDTACVMAALGIPTHTTPIPCSTPQTAFAVKHLGAVAGVMVTASHNPPEYNGYKVYWGNGAQIIPPHDHGIATAIEGVPPADQVVKMPLAEAKAKGIAETYGFDLEETYLAEVAKLRIRSDGDRKMAIVYTPLHGTGERLCRRALEAAGFSNVATVAEQAKPDGTFPTVAFPNPEEKGALDLALALAKRNDASLIIANDPDVDRLAIAVKNPAGAFVQLTGNQVGALLGHYLMTEGKQGDKRLALASCVSSPMLGVIAERLGVHYEETLTGFKWIANRAMQLEREKGLTFVFGFEEALGYTVGSLVRDKDGISAAVLVAEMAAVLRAQGKTLLDRLDDLYREYGLFVSGQRSITMKGETGLQQIGEVMKRLRAARPKSVGPLAVAATRDFEARVRTAADGANQPIDLPATNMLMFDLAGGSRIIARPSGTEPKIKFYFDVREGIERGEAITSAEARAGAQMNALMTAFVALAGVG
jgi:phosphomannomutase